MMGIGGWRAVGWAVRAHDAAITFPIEPGVGVPRRSVDHDGPIERAQRAQSERIRHPYVPVGAEKA